MNQTDGDTIAHRLLEELQEAVTAKDVDRLLALFSDDPVLFGTTAANLDRQQTRRYLEMVVDQDGFIRWDFQDVVTLVSSPGLVSFAAVGTVGFDDATGRATGRRDAFRLTCVAVEEGDRWRLRHFHGSVPQA